MVSLYKLTDQVQGLARLMEADFIDEDTLADTLDGLDGELAQKTENILAYIQNEDGDVKALDAEIKRLKGRKQVIQNRQDRLKDYLRDNMIRLEMTNIKCPLFSITLRKAPPVCVIDDLEQVPNIYINTTVTPDKTLIKAALKRGDEVAGCRLVDGQQGLMIR